MSIRGLSSFPQLSPSSALNSTNNQQPSKQPSKFSKLSRLSSSKHSAKNAIHIHHRCPLHGPRGHCSPQSQQSTSTNLCSRLNCRVLHNKRPLNPRMRCHPTLAHPSIPPLLWRSLLTTRHQLLHAVSSTVDSRLAARPHRA